MARAIELRGVGKRFTKYVDTPMLLTAAMRFRPHTRREKLWAIRGVDFVVEDGECVGVIGRNGSGKSTMMTMMAGITAPTEGSVRVWGRVAPLISVGVGFHRELTGRENIYVNGSIIGLTRREIDSRLEQIIDFAEIEGFIDTPVKFYSSGMFVRLGFAVAAHADPDVMLVDEVLAVGDVAFQLKCFERMQQIRRNGTTIVLVSHNLGAIQKMCERVLLVHDGTPVVLGSPDDAIAKLYDILTSSCELQQNTDWGTHYEPGVVAIEGMGLTGGGSVTRQHVNAGEPVSFRVQVRALQAIDDFRLGFVLFGPDGSPVYADISHILGPLAADDATVYDVSFRAQLPTGTYSATAHISRPDLRTNLAQGRPCSFFVNGRDTVAGVADLEATFGRGPAEDNDRDRGRTLSSVVSGRPESPGAPHTFEEP